jgi:hypothetical protein
VKLLENRYSQLENENWFEYAERLIENRKSGVYDIDKAEVYELLTGETVSADHARKMLCFLEKLLSKYKYVLESKIESNDEIKKLQEIKREVYKERQKLRDEKNEYNTWDRIEARHELFCERINEAADKIMSRKSRVIPESVEIKLDSPKLVVGFADAHYDENFKIVGFNNEIINEYNVDVFRERMWKLRDEIIDFAKLHKINELSICDLGDCIAGLIHVNQLKSIRENIVDAILDYADFMEDWLYSLSDKFIINYYTSEGNHSDIRLLGGKKGDTEGENLEKIYARVIQKAFKNNPNITIHSNLDGMNFFDIDGYTFLTNHGQNDNNPEPTVRGYEDTYNIKVNYYMSGHLHTNKELDLALNKEFIQFRSVMGINIFSKGIRKTSKAGAKMFTVHKGIGKKYVNDVIFN